MITPAEQLTVAWLQECRHYFVMTNIKVPKKHGGMSAEIDIIAINRKRAGLWVEVNVSTNPRCRYRKEVRFKKTVEDFISDFFRKDKRKKVREYLGIDYKMMLVYGMLALTRPEAEKFPEKIKRYGIEPVFFEDVIRDLGKLRGYRLDTPRAYVNLFKEFGGCLHGKDKK
jgi:hypothetical protein